MFFPNKKFKQILVGILLVFTVGLALAIFAHPVLASGSSSVDLGLKPVAQNIGLGTQDIRLTVAKIIRVALGLLGIVALGIILYAGYLYMTAGGNEDQIGTAKKWIKNGVIGLVIILSAYAIVSFVISKLVEATTGNYPAHCSNNICDGDESCMYTGGDPDCGGSCAACKGGCSDPSCANFIHSFFVRSLPDAGQHCVVNLGLKILFSQPIDMGSLVAGGKNKIKVVKEDGTYVDGTWDKNDADGYEIIFKPSQVCAAGCSAAGCFDPKAKYILKFPSTDTEKATIVSTGGDTLKCFKSAQSVGCDDVLFTTGEACDTQSPVVSLSAYPMITSGETAPFYTSSTDDTGVKQTNLYVDSVGSPVDFLKFKGCNTAVYGTLYWATPPVETTVYRTTTVKSYDDDSNIGTAEMAVALMPSHCDDREQDDSETGLDCGGTCPKCDGDCTKNLDCRSGYCDTTTGKCLDRVVITKVSPLSAGKGSFVTISGNYFGTNPGTVEFEDRTTGTWYPAKLANCGSTVSAWNQWEIVVEAPLVKDQSGPVRVKTADWTSDQKNFYKMDTTDDNWGGFKADFTGTDKLSPSLCPINPNSGFPKATAILKGKYFGQINSTKTRITRNNIAADYINFGDSKAQVVDWGSYDDATELEQISGLVPGISTGWVGVQVFNDGYSSNAVSYRIKEDISNDPRIDSIDPTSGANGEYITIDGANFGKDPGQVLFYKDGDLTGTPVIGSNSFPAGCDSANIWGDKEIVVKFPENTGSAGDIYYVVVKRNSDGKVSAAYSNFTFVGGQAKPGICKISPATGPIPLPVGTYMEVIGERLTSTTLVAGDIGANVYFWTNGANASTTDGKLPINHGRLAANQTFTIENLSLGQKISNLSIPDSAKTGPVLVERGSDKKVSNALKYSELNCVANGQPQNNLCGASKQCCAVNNDSGYCIPDTDLCPGQTRSTGYSWRFTTRDILPVPRVVENCDSSNRSMPSPSPSTLWSQRDNNDHYNVCRQALLTIEFNMAMDSSTLSNKNVIVRECASTTSTNSCVTPGDAIIMKDAFGGTGSAGYYITAGGSSAAGIMSALKLSPDNASSTKKIWKDNTWYQVILTKNIKSMPTDINDWANTQSTLSVDRPCSDYPNSAYCFVFKTDSQDCKLKTVMILPTKWWTSVLEEPIKQHDVTGDYNLLWEGVGVSTQKCILMDAGSHNWVWDVKVRTSTENQAVVNDEYSKVTDLTHKYPKIKNLSYFEQFDALKNTAKIGLFDLFNSISGIVSTTDSVFVHTSVTVTSSDDGRSTTYEAYSPLTIDLSDPEVVDYWPNCLEACTNAEVGVRFNTTMSNFNLSHDGTVKLYQCLDENCLSKIEATTNSLKLEDVGNTFEPGSNYTILKIANSKSDSLMLASNTLYLVTISAPSSTNNGQNTLWSANEYNRPDTQGKPFNQEFSWRFKTKAAQCLVNKVTVSPSEYVSAYIGDKSLYTAQPYSSPDSCAKAGQKLNPWSVQWDWFVPDRAPDKYIAKISKFVINRHSDYCTDNCLLKGSDIPAQSATSTVVIPICGNGVVEAGEDCDPPNAALGCSLNCLNVGDWNYNLLSKTNGVTGRCGDGVVNTTTAIVQIAGESKSVTYGEECDYTSPDPAIRYGCAKNCLRSGSQINPSGTSTSTSICGNGTIGAGETCELGIDADPTNPQSSLGCSTNCLHTGTYLSKRWCSDHVNDYGGFSTSSYQKICATAYSQCGDGIWSLDEDKICENSAPPYWNSKDCTEYCLKKVPMACTPNREEGCDNILGQHLGSSLTYTVPSLCGDGFAGTGEDVACESDQYRTQTYNDGVVSPWAIATGLGLYATTSTVDSESADIDAKASGDEVQGKEKVGTGKFTIPCGFDSDASCQNAFGAFAPAGQEYAVGSNTCCFLRARLVNKYPANNAKDVCPNTVIRATFDQTIDESTLSGNAFLAFGMTKDQVDNYSATSPSLNKFYDHVTSTNHLIYGNYLYLINNSADGSGTLEIRKNNTTTPTLVGSITTSSATYNSLIWEQNYVFIAGTQGIDVIAVLNAKAPKFVYRINTESEPVKILVSNNYLFAALRNGKLVIWKMDSDVNYIKVNEINLGSSGFKFYISSSYLYTVGDFGVKVFDIAEAVSSNSPRLIASLNGVFTDLGISGSKVYLTRNNNLDVYTLNWDNNHSPVTASFVPERTDFVISTDTPFTPTEIKIKGDYAYLSDSDSQLQVVRIAATSTLVRTFVIPGFSHLRFTLDEDSELLYTFGDTNFRVYDVSGYFVPVCDKDVTNLVASALDINTTGQLPWYKKLWNNITDFVKNIFGIRALAISTVPRAPIVKWCVSNSLNNATVENVDATSTSYVNFNLSAALAQDTDYAIILTSGVKDTRGVSIGKDNNGKAWGWKFTTDNKPICKINKTVINPVPAANFVQDGTVVTVDPTSVFFTRLNTLTKLEADVYEESGQAIQPVTGYTWNFVWKPTVDTVVLINSTTAQTNDIQAHNQNGDATVVATANVLSNDFPDYNTGLTGDPGTAAITVFLCENPWPPIQQGEYNATNNSVFPYSDTEDNKNNFNFSLGNYGQFDGNPIIPGHKGRYFNFKFYYCADSGANGTTTDDLPYFEPAVQPGRSSFLPNAINYSVLAVKNSSYFSKGFNWLSGLLKVDKALAAAGTCSYPSGQACNNSCGCGKQFTYNQCEYSEPTVYNIPAGYNGVCAGVRNGTGICAGEDMMYSSASGCNSVSDCNSQPGFVSWVSSNGVTAECYIPDSASTYFATCNGANNCGDGCVNVGEQCDDGNTVATDSCNNSCKLNIQPSCSWVMTDCSGASCGAAGTQTAVCKSLGLLDCSTCDAATKPTTQQCTVTSGCCGNGIKDTGETCDDGNTTSGDGCSATCQQETGYLCVGAGANSCHDCNKCYDSDFPYDPANYVSSSATFLRNNYGDITGYFVGNSSTGYAYGDAYAKGYVVTGGSNCSVSYDSCFSNNVLERACAFNSTTKKYYLASVGWWADNKGRVCNDGVYSYCGNGKLDSGEMCDDKNITSGDGCSSSCTTEPGYTCTNSSSDSPSVCVKKVVCGNGIIEANEKCDDGNTTSSDGCSATCQVESNYNCSGSPSTCCKWVSNNNCNCSTGKLLKACQTSTGSSCSVCVDDGSNISCSASQLTTCNCGNGKLDSGETCDDGNTTSGDGCSATCQQETGYNCVGTPSNCYHWVTNDNSCNCVTGKKDRACQTYSGLKADALSDCLSSILSEDCTAQQNLACKCNNGLLDTGEKCDTDVNGNFIGPAGQQNCSDLGNYNSGLLRCVNSCQTISTSTCHYCGDGLATDQEACDKDDFKGQTCANTLGSGYNTPGGNLTCNSNCTISTSTCHYCGDGVCNSDTEDFGSCPSDCETPGLIGKALKRFIFTNKNNSDAIGIQVFDNPNHLTVSKWYSQNSDAVGGGTPQALMIDGYDAISDGKNLFIDALNYVTSTSGGKVIGKIYSNIYLFSHNSDASDSTLNVFEQIIKNLHFNTNLTNYGYCGVDVNSPNYLITCSTDNDCPRDCDSDTTVGNKDDCVSSNYPQYCSNQIDKLKRNYQRLRDLQTINDAVYNYSKYSGLASYWNFDNYTQNSDNGYYKDVVGNNNFVCIDNSCGSRNIVNGKFDKAFKPSWVGGQLVSSGDSSIIMNGQATVILWFKPAISVNGYSEEVFGGFPFASGDWKKKDLWTLSYQSDKDSKIILSFGPKNLYKYFNNNAQKFAAFVNNADDTTKDIIANSNNYIAATGKLNVINGYNFLALRFSGNSVSFNLNDQKYSTTTVSSWGNFNIGRLVWSAGNAGVDEFLVFNRVLSDTEIDSFYNNYTIQKNKIGVLPTLSEGSYLTGQTLSTWSQSWSVLSSNLGLSLPTDPINQLGGGGTCGTSSKATKFCFKDSDCPDGQTCVLHDSTTGWSAADRRFSFACDDLRSFAYRYIYQNDTNSFKLLTKLEGGDGMGLISWDPTNKNDFINAFVDPGRVYLNSVCNSAGGVNGSNEVTSMSAGVCGDGVVNLNMGEECDPKGSTQRYNFGCKDSNNSVYNTYQIKSCNSNCKWDYTDNKCYNDSSKLCGNGRIDPGESCDDGVLNGQYNHCAAGCGNIHDSLVGWCGDGKKQSQELCDPSAYKTCVGGMWSGINCSNNDSCNSACFVSLKGTYQDDTGATHQETKGIYYSNVSSANCKGNFCDSIGNKGITLFDYEGQSFVLTADDCKSAQNDGYAYTWKYENISLDNDAWFKFYIGGMTGKCVAGIFYDHDKIKSCSWDCQHYGEYCGDGITQSDYEECDGNQSCKTLDGKNGKRFCDNNCKMVNKNSDGSFGLASTVGNWVCVPDTADAVTYSSSCGDGTINTDNGEICDAGAKNGVPCTPGSGGSCSYCSWDCRNIVDVNSYVAYDRDRDCGDGVVQAPYEICDNKYNSACNATCDGICGNGKVEGGEYCDPNDPTTKNGCNSECFYDRCKLKYCDGADKNCKDTTKSWWNNFNNCNKNYTLGYCGDDIIENGVANVIKYENGDYTVTSMATSGRDVVGLEECEPAIGAYDSSDLYNLKTYEECSRIFGNGRCHIKGYNRTANYRSVPLPFSVTICSDGGNKFNSSDLACTFADKTSAAVSFKLEKSLCGTPEQECDWSRDYDQTNHIQTGNCSGSDSLCNTCKNSYGKVGSPDNLADSDAEDGYWLNYSYQSVCNSCDASTGECTLCTRSCRQYNKVPAQTPYN